jgi:hypothetical protein
MPDDQPPEQKNGLLELLKNLWLPLVFLLAACGPVTSSATSPTTTLMPTSTPPVPTLQPTLRPTLTPELTSIQSIPLKFFYPQIEKYCPSNREVPIEKLGIGQDSQIILADANQTGIWSLGSESHVPKLLSSLSSAKWTSSSISPDGKWIAYTTLDTNFAYIWLFSLATGENKLISKLEYWDGMYPIITWLSDQKIMIWNGCRSSACRYPLSLINIETGNMEDLTKSPSVGEPYGEYLAFFEKSNQDYAVFNSDATDDYNSFFVYDYANVRKVGAFPWLEKRVFFFPDYLTNISFEFAKTHTAMLLEQSYGFDLGIVENSINAYTETNSYDVVMKRIAAKNDTGFDELRYFPIGLDAPTGSLFLEMSYRPYSDAFQDSPNIENGFFSLDYQNVVSTDHVDSLIFKDYCFPMADNYLNGIFANGTIAVFESYEGNELTFINLNTGNLSRLSGWKFMGWRSTGK